jgi:excisionase family DNA binding protein
MMEGIFKNETKFYSTADIARLLSVDPSTVKRWADSGRLQCYKTVGGHRRFSLSQVKEFITSYHLEGIVSSSVLQSSGAWSR